jgi:IS30 family transposase
MYRRIGEVDTVVSRQSKGAVMVAVGRKNRLFIVQKMGDKTAPSMHEAIVTSLPPFPEEMRKSITYDNGTENALHEMTNAVLGTESYFCKPYHSWEKGSIENRNGILRRFFPKATRLGIDGTKGNRVKTRVYPCHSLWRTPRD